MNAYAVIKDGYVYRDSRTEQLEIYDLESAARRKAHGGDQVIEVVVRASALTMDDAVTAGDGVLLQEQAALLRKCRAALEAVLTNNKAATSMYASSGTEHFTLGNLCAELGAYRPRGVFGTTED